MYQCCFLLLGCLYLLLSASCSHQSTIKPSDGHIDAENSVSATPVQPTPAIVPPKAHIVTEPLPVKLPVYSVLVHEVPVKEILFAMARDSQLNVDIHPAIQGRVTLNAVDQTLPVILQRLSRQVDMTYHMDGNVLVITPDHPVLRTYQVDYVNINRDTIGFIGAAAEISSTGKSAFTGENGTVTTNISNGNGASNSSRTSVTSESKHHLWDNLIQNIKELLQETDKEVIVARTGVATTTTNQDEKTLKTVAYSRDAARKEYKTLFASKVIANPETGVIAVRATARQHEKVREFLSTVLLNAKKQVLIEATIVEVMLKDSFQSGIDWRRLNNTSNHSGFVFGQTLGANSVRFNPQTGATSVGEPDALGAAISAGIVAGYINPVSRLGSIAASITLLEKFGKTKVISSPKLMVLNNQTAVLKVVDNLVYFTIQSQISQSLSGGAGSNLQSVTTTANTVPVGVVMTVTPQINTSNLVSLDVRPTISRVLGYVQDPNPQLGSRDNRIVSAIPQIQVREMESVLSIASGNIAVLGGLMQDEVRNHQEAIPGISELPAFGQVFKGNNDATQKTELVIFIRPTVVPNANLDSQALQSFKQYLPAKQLEQALQAVQREGLKEAAW